MLEQDYSTDRLPTTQVLDVLTLLGPLLGEWLPSITSSIAALVKNSKETPTRIRLVALRAMVTLLQQQPASLMGEWSGVVHLVSQILATEPDCKTEIMPLLSFTVSLMGREYITLGHMVAVNRLLATLNIECGQYRELVACLVENEPLPLVSLEDFRIPGTQAAIIPEKRDLANRVKQTGVFKVSWQTTKAGFVCCCKRNRFAVS